MQLARLNKERLIPLVVAGGVVTTFGYKYNELDHSKLNFKITNQATASFVSNADDRYYSDLSIKSIFYQKLELWKINTLFMSFATQIISDENFKDIVSMGDRVTPFIIEEISNEPSPLVWALNFIYQRTISENPETTIEQACKLWINEMR